MYVRTRATSTVVAVAAGLLIANPLASADGAATHSRTAGLAGAASHVPTVVAHVSDSAIHLSVGHRLHAGRVVFRVVTKQGGHTLQLLRLHNGYTMKQASQDINKAFQGDLKAIHRVDHRISWLGGATARPGRPGEFSVNLHHGHLIVLDQSGNASTRLHVFGTPRHRPLVPATSSITTFTYGFSTSKPTLPHSGWARAINQSDQPHFIVFQRVKDGTTKKMVRKFIRSHLRGNPSWVLKANTSIGVISSQRREVFSYDLPRGKYLLACFWPDDESGMPHIAMGMWKLIWLR